MKSRALLFRLRLPIPLKYQLLINQDIIIKMLQVISLKIPKLGAYRVQMACTIHQNLL
jgi:hypothetical protein